jgi:hypothetical protein
MSDLETIKSLAAKLAALAAPGSGATDNERLVAFGKLESLLKRHGLTMEDLHKEETHTMWVKVRNKGERELFHACAFFILERKKIDIERRVGKPLDASVAKVTAVQSADIGACFSHYVKILRAKVHCLNEEIKTARAARLLAHKGVIQNYDIYPPEEEGDTYRMPTDEELAALRKAMQGLKGDAWVKPAAKVGIAKVLFDSAQARMGDHDLYLRGFFNDH